MPKHNLYSINLYKSLKIKKVFNQPFLLWVVFPTPKEQYSFYSYCKTKGLKYQMLKVTKRKGQAECNRSWLVSGGPVIISCKSLEELSEMFRFFFEKSFDKINTFNFIKIFNTMSGFVTACKFFDFIFPLNKSFSIFFKHFTTALKVNESFFYLILIKITMVILISIMLITTLFNVHLQRFFFLTLKSFSLVIFYANKKSIS